jgi:hypothetical protein
MPNPTASRNSAPAMKTSKRLGSYLVDAGLITPGQIEVALNDQQVIGSGTRFGEILVTRGWIKQQTLDYLIDKVVEPEQTAAQQAPKAAASVQNTASSMSSSAASSAAAGRTTSPGVAPSERRPAMATARPLDSYGSPVVVVFDQPTAPAVAANGGRDTDSNQPINVRKPLVALTDEDGVSWAG